MKSFFREVFYQIFPFMKKPEQTLYDRILLKLNDYISLGLLILVLYTLALIINCFKSNLVLVDYLWGLSFILQSIFYFYKESIVNEKYSWEKVLFTTVSITYSLRLSVFMILKKYKMRENFQYIKFLGKLRLPFIFLSQAILSILIGLVLFEFNSSDQKFLDLLVFWFGILLMIIGTFLHSMADIQLYNFKTNTNQPMKVLDNRAWSLCRHPNYFGASLFWWGAYICNTSVGIYYNIFSPILFTILLLIFYAIPTERYLIKTKGDAYKNYIKKVPLIIPFSFKRIKNFRVFKKNEKIEKKREKRSTKLKKFANSAEELKRGEFNKNKRQSIRVNNFSFFRVLQ